MRIALNATEERKAPGPRFIKQGAPTLYAIITIKMLKGFLFATLAVVIYTLSDNDLPYEYQRLLHFLRLNPERKFLTDLALQVSQLTESKVVLTAAATLLYSLFSLVEGIGLMFRVGWAGWMSIGESAFFIPIEIYELVIRPFSLTVLAILAINVTIVCYLYRNRQRLFRHRH